MSGNACRPTLRLRAPLNFVQARQIDHRDRLALLLHLVSSFFAVLLISIVPSRLSSSAYGPGPITLAEELSSTDSSTLATCKMIVVLPMHRVRLSTRLQFLLRNLAPAPPGSSTLARGGAHGVQPKFVAQDRPGPSGIDLSSRRQGPSGRQLERSNRPQSAQGREEHGNPNAVVDVPITTPLA